MRCVCPLRLCVAFVRCICALRLCAAFVGRVYALCLRVAFERCVGVPNEIVILKQQNVEMADDFLILFVSKISLNCREMRFVDVEVIIVNQANVEMVDDFVTLFGLKI